MHVDGYASLDELLVDACRRHPSATLLVEAHRKREVGRRNGAEVLAEARAFAAYLQQLGVGPGDRVALLMSNQSRWPLTAMAVFLAGGVLVPLDYKLSGPEQAGLLAHCAPAVVVLEYGEWRKHDAIAGVVVVSEAPEGAELGDAVRWGDHDRSAVPEAVPPRQRDDLATIVYSSGTGGRPKGCMLAHGAYLSQLDALLQRFPMEPGHRYFSILPSNHAIDFMVGFVGPFVCGATVVHQRTLRPELIRWTMKRYAITHMSVVPLLLSAFEDTVRERLDELSGWRRTAFEALRATNAKLTERVPRPEVSRKLLAPIHDAFGGALQLLICGGAATDRSTAEFFYDLGIPVVIGYGLTEACTVVSVHGLSPWRADGVGQVVPGVTVRIHEPDGRGVGEVCVAGDTVMMGYLDEPELTAETLRDGWLHTGDLGYLDASHHLHLVGRIKDVIVTPGGKNVYPEDIAFAFRDVPCEELAVFAAHTLWPDAGLDDDLVVVVRPEEGVDPLPALRGANRGLAEHQRVRRWVRWSAEFPRTASMKIKRGVLAAEVGVAVAPSEPQGLG
jgi:long-chain acyl-CoA synthetase